MILIFSLLISVDLILSPSSESLLLIAIIEIIPIATRKSKDTNK